MDSGTYRPGPGIADTLARIDFRAQHGGEGRIAIVVRGDVNGTAARQIATYAERVGLSLQEVCNVVRSADGRGATPAGTTVNRAHRRQIAAIVNRVVRAD